MSRTMRAIFVAAAIAAGAAAAVVPHLRSRGPSAASELMRLAAPAIGMPGAPPTSPGGLRQRIADMEARLQRRPNDATAALALADALLRQARATNDGRPTNRAAVVLRAVLNEDPGQYDALRLLGAVYLSQHRFRDALETGRRARNLRPSDAWNDGVIGDALVELGEYDSAFDAFDTMVSLRPGADAYARVSYARELRGDLAGALEVMQLAASATTAHDAEAKAWYTAHVGELYLRLGRLADAEREYRRAAFFYPNYPHAVVGLGKVKAERGELDAALTIYREQFERTPTLDLAARIGDILAGRGATAESERYYELAEVLAGPPPAQSEASLALFLAEHDRKLSDALRIAQAVANTRHDIMTDDALAWTLFKMGRIGEAFVWWQRAMRTGTRDERILRHGEAIQAALNGRRVASVRRTSDDAAPPPR
jgi:tetratricopeptide (TPR) repeat protein